VWTLTYRELRALEGAGVVSETWPEEDEPEELEMPDEPGIPEAV
jgi:hypothetical protein